MERVAAGDELTPSILSRLIDQSPGTEREGPASRPKLADIRRAVRQDLEDLLNTRWSGSKALEQMESLHSSLANYGIPDFLGANLQAAQDPDQIFRAIEHAIEEFEPRLKNVHIKPSDAGQSVDRTLRFQIDAVLYVESLRERVRFNSTLDTASGKISVKPNDRS